MDYSFKWKYFNELSENIFIIIAAISQGSYNANEVK